jgi:hypothetical protein
MHCMLETAAGPSKRNMLFPVIKNSHVDLFVHLSIVTLYYF